MPKYIDRDAFIKRLENEADRSSDIINLLILNGIANIVRDENIAPTVQMPICNNRFNAPKKLYHVTTPKKAKLYHESSCIYKPVRGFTTFQAALAWAVKTGRTVIYEVNGNVSFKLPDHHNKFGEAWYFDENIYIENVKCVFSAEKDA